MFLDQSVVTATSSRLACIFYAIHLRRPPPTRPNGCTCASAGCAWLLVTKPKPYPREGARLCPGRSVQRTSGLMQGVMVPLRACSACSHRMTAGRSRRRRARRCRAHSARRRCGAPSTPAAPSRARRSGTPPCSARTPSSKAPAACCCHSEPRPALTAARVCAAGAVPLLLFAARRGLKHSSPCSQFHYPHSFIPIRFVAPTLSLLPQS